MQAALDIIRTSDGCGHEAQKRRNQTLPARTAKLRKDDATKLAKAAEDKGELLHELALVSALAGEQGRVARVASKLEDNELAHKVKLWALQRLAFSSKQKGTMLVRQNMGTQLLASTALRMQTASWHRAQDMAIAARQRHLQQARSQPGASTPRSESSPSGEVTEHGRFVNILGCRLMWDEAGQKLRGLASRLCPTSASTGKFGNKGSSQVVVNVMAAVCMLTCVVMYMTTSSCVMAQRWEPWLMPCRLMPRTTANHVLAALIPSMPFQIDDAESMRKFGSACFAAILVLICDSAASNLRALRYLFYHAQRHCFLLVFAQICFVHQLHITKTQCLDMVGLAGVMFSFSKVMKMSTALSALAMGMRQVLRSSLRLRAPGPGASTPGAESEFLEVVHTIYGIDGNEDRLYREVKGTRVPTAFYQDILDLSDRVHFDSDGGMSFFLSSDARHTSADLHRIMHDAVEYALEPLMNMFVLHRWEVAALSRWTHVTENLKRTVLGVVAGRVLPRSVAALQVAMQLNEQKIDAILAKAAAVEAAGGKDGSCAWAKAAKGVIRVSKYFSDTSNYWRMGCILLVSGVCDRLHHGLVGYKRTAKATLQSLVDPETSLVAVAQESLLDLLETYTLDRGCRWFLLTWLGVQSASDATVRHFARSLIIRASCGIFRRLVIRLSALMYKLQWMISPNTTEDEKDFVCRLVLDLPGHCRSLFLQGLIRLCPTLADLRGHVGVGIVRNMESTLIFSSDEVERENAHIRRCCSSGGKGRQHNPVINGDLCRKIREYHCLRGGKDPAIGLPDKEPESDALPTPFLAAPSAESASTPLPVQRSDASHTPAAESASTPRGGNPKLCYVNHRMAAVTETLTQGQWETRRQTFLGEYDAMTQGQRDRWKTVFAHKGMQAGSRNGLVQTKAEKRESHRQPAHAQLVQADRTEFAPIWRGSWPGVRSSASTPRMPFSYDVLSDTFESEYGSGVRKLQEASGGDSKFTLGDETVDRCHVLGDTPAHVADDARRIWGCGVGWKNVCALLKTQRSEAIASSLSGWVDSLSKDYCQILFGSPEC